MERIISTKDIKIFKFLAGGLLALLLLNTSYQIIYTAIARKDCYQTARGAMGAPDGTHAILQGDQGITNSTAYSTYFSMCMNNEYGLNQ